MAKTSSSLPAGGNLLHNTLLGLNDGDYQHLTMLEKANLEFITNKQNSLTIDGTGTKYPTVDAVNAGIVSGSTPDATLTIKGKLKLAGDLSGTADVPLINVKTINTIPIKGSGDIIIDKISIGLGNVDNTSDLNKPVSTATQNALNLKENKAEKNQINGYAGLDGSGKIFSNQLPALAVTDTFVVNSQAAMLALTTAETGDLAVRTDLNKTFILKGTNFSLLGDWQELLTPTSAVTSVFGRNGAVVANPGDYNTSLVSDTLNKRYVTDANLVTIGNQSGVNTGDNSPNSLYSGLVSNATHTGDASGATVLTLATVNSNIGIFGNASNVAQVTVNGKGLTTAVSNIPIQIVESQVTNLIADLALKANDDNVIHKIGNEVKTGTLETTSFIKTGGLITEFLKADGSVDSNSYALTSNLHNPVTIGTANGLSLAIQVLSLALASTSTNGALSSTDWNTFNNKQPLLTNPVTGTGTAGQVAFWNGTNVIAGDTGLVYDSTSNIITVSGGGNYRVNRTINGTQASPNYEPLVTYGQGTAFDAGVYGGNSLATNNGTFLKFVVNSTTALNTPIDAMIIPATGNINIPLSVGIGTNANSANKLDVFGSKTTAYTSSLTGPTTDFTRIANVHNSGGTDQYSALALMVTGNNGTNNAYVNLNVIQPTAANSAAEFTITVRQTSGVMNEVLRAKTNGNIILPSSDARLVGGDSTGRLVMSNSTTTSYVGLNGAMHTTPNEIQLVSTTGNIRMLTNNLERFTVLNNGSVGIGATVPVGKLDVNTGISGLTFNMVNQSIGSIVLSNGAATEAPSLSGKSNSNQYGIRFVAGTIDTNTSTDMLFQVMENDQTDYSAPNLGSSAFRFARFSTTLIDVLRNGNTTFVGNITTIAGTTANHVVIKSQLDAVVPSGIKLYKALITQTSTGAPTVTILFNTIGAIVWTRTAAGSYVGTLTSAFTPNKTMCFINNTSAGFNIFQQATTNTVTLVTQDITGTNLDGKITNASITIEVYP